MEWIVITSKAGAKIYEWTSEGRFRQLETYRHPLGRAKNFEMTNDQPGMSQAKFAGAAPYSLSKEKDPKEVAAENFAITISKSLKTKLNRDHDLNLIIVAEPKMMGKLRHNFKEHHLQSRVSWVDKDLQNVPQDKWDKILTTAQESSKGKIRHYG